MQVSPTDNCTQWNNSFQYLKGAYREAGEGLFVQNSSDRARINGYKLREGKFRLGIRKELFTVRIWRETRMGCPGRL